MTLTLNRPAARCGPPLPAEGDWFDLYPKNRSKDMLYTQKSTEHPAKMSLPLLRKIIQEFLAYGMLKPGSTLLDPFGGRGSTATEWCKLWPENRAITCELEGHYIDMQWANKAQAEEIMGRPLDWIIMQGDSRKLDEYLSQIDASVTSPPYGKGVIGGCNEKAAARLRGLTQDPKSSLYGRDPEGAWFQAMIQGYQPSAGNIDLLPVDRDFAELEELLATGSPPYEDSLCSDDPKKRGGLFRDPKRAADKSLTGNYNGSYTEELVGVGSQPFEAQSGGHPEIKSGPLADPRLHARHAASRIGKAGGYSEATDGQIGNRKGESYADACRDVYRALWRAQVRYVALVTKNPVKNQKLKRLDLLTEKLMQDAGYQVIARRRAYLWQTVAQLRERGVIYPQPERPRCSRKRDKETGQMVSEPVKLDVMFWEKWDERPVGEITFFNSNHMLQGRIPPSQWEDVLFFERSG